VTITSLSLPVSDAPVPQVTAALHTPSRRRGPAVLLAPGAGGNLEGDGLRALAEVLVSLGLPVVRTNLPHHEAGRRAAPKAEHSVNAYRQLVAAAQQATGITNPWILGGKSYGGRVASMAVADGLEAVGLLFYGYPLHPPGKPDRLRVDHWPHVTVPCLFLQGDRDTFASGDLLSTSVRKLPRRSTVHVVAGADHSLRITGKASPTGTPSSEATTVTGLAPVIADWLGTLDT
jgi:uncharacterized protein